MSKKMRLKSLGCKEIELYSVFSNYGYKFKINNINYDLRHVLIEYGNKVDYYTLKSVNLNLEFKTWEEVIEFLKGVIGNVKC